MAKAKVAVTLDEKILLEVDRLVTRRIFPNRSKAIEEAVQEKLDRLSHARLARECAKLDPQLEKALAEEGILILSHDIFNARSGTVIAVALTSKAPRTGFPLTLEINSSALPKQSWVKISQIRTLATERIGAKIAEATPDEVAETVAGLNEILG